MLDLVLVFTPTLLPITHTLAPHIETLMRNIRLCVRRLMLSQMDNGMIGTQKPAQSIFEKNLWNTG